MNETTRATSTARRIGWAWLRRFAASLLALNLALAVIAAVLFCHAQEKAALGADWTIAIERRLELPEGADGPLEAAMGAVYVFYAPDGARCEAPLEPHLRRALPAMVALLTVEVLMLPGQFFSGRRAARRLLRPLERMARATRELGRRSAAPPSRASEETLHDLERAIGRISPERPGERLEMGDSDLAGLQDAINGLLDRMRDAQRQQSQFVSDASHELRTPIAVIQGYAGMLERWGKRDEKVLDESISAIRAEAAYMSHLVEQLLFLARGEAGRAHMARESVDLGELAREVCEECRMIDDAHDWRAEAASGALALGDRELLKQCARILTDNAMKYTPAGGMITLRAGAAGGEARMEVQDSGIGISGEDMPRVFDRFYRSDPARSRAGGGAGLGLAIARWIVEAHGGHIELLSREGIGTRVTVCLQKSEM